MNVRLAFTATVCACMLAGTLVHAQGQPRSSPSDVAAPAGEADPWDELGDKRPERRDNTVENIWLSSYSITLLGLSPLAIAGFQDDVTYNEGALLVASTALGAGSMAVGGALLGGGVVLTYVGWLCMEIGVEAPLLGILLVPTGLVLMTVGVVGGLGGAGLMFGSTIVTTAGLVAADGAIGDGGEFTFGVTAAVTGGLVLGTFGGFLVISQSHADPWLQTVAVIVTGMFGASLAYGLFRHVEGGAGQQMVIVTPVLTF